ncbi:hypothetical protein AMATHDRAFT_77336 [Amanita thiersii Skay4041]|uniref:AAA+ ATPase domain-containing protein n=1 Tax=Amanita thiersii Skay4041 TaxID=703135 RepID=A0A2A9N8P0_9AGAR|nr:hypothetical protein AMATHDRAFT_77336 [Amanita thiersii Skay4041]
MVSTRPPPQRRSTRLVSRTASDSVGASGSEYHESVKSMESHIDPANIPPEDLPKYQTRGGRTVRRKSYKDADTTEDENDHGGIEDLFNDNVKATNVSRTRSRVVPDDDDDEEEQQPRFTRRNNRSSTLDGFIVEDEDDHLRPNTRLRTRNQTQKATRINGTGHSPNTRSAAKRRHAQRNHRRGAEDEDVYVDNPSSGGSADGEGSLDDAMQTSDLDLEPEPEHEPEPEDEVDGKPYSLRQRQRINYALPPPLEEMTKPPPKQNGNRHGGSGWRAPKRRGPGWSASGAELGRWMGMGGDDSDSDHATRTPRKPFGGIAPLGSGMAAGGLMPGDLATSGTPSNLGRIGEAALADADPLGVNMGVTFDEVGGLDEHIHSLKEMTLLPLLYPEVFQRFNVTPPRGVLFHGPPGTGKTLMARALAASCRSNGKQISFFMRKGADCLSKWVGEAERQLRLLFEEAKASQPSIIFFDEIDGLAPVRSSKQDQIHASIVSTLLALMDGMDGRGQVVVIGATNRPDAVDPALRRPGRFDREFYFGLPGVDAREKILGIMTRKWAGWGEEGGEDCQEKVKGLAKLTKGYGGADLRALCTEAALNAVQRRYPQIYKSTDRLLLKPETINVGLRDFMISIKKIVPSSARSSSSAAGALPSQFVPLLGEVLEKVKNTISQVLPMEKRLSALEEAEYEDEGGEEGALEKEMFAQSMQTLRVYRPRVVIHGSVGMGQTYIGAAALHHLEGYHIQSLELGTLMGDSTRTVEAAIVQLFVEAKRHQPSVVYIPSLVGWCAAVAETSRSTVRSMLDTLAPTDPILLLAVVDGEFSSLPKDVKSWFGPTKNNRIVLTSPTEDQREAFFEGLVKDICRPPNMYADGMQRKKRVLEELPIAPPLEPRQPTAAELALQDANDQRTIALLKYRLGPILTELKRKFKRFTKRANEEYNLEPTLFPNFGEVITIQPAAENGPNGVVHVDDAGSAAPVENGQVNVSVDDAQLQQQQQQQQLQQQAVLLEQPKLYDMDLERMHAELYKSRYLTPQDFLDDVAKIVHNAQVRAHEDLDRMYKAQAMFTAAEVSILEFDPALRLECERMAPRERKRREEHRKSREKAKGKSQDEHSQSNGPTMMTRRSARANGLEPELRITDPVKLERRLKRQRSENGEATTDSHGSEEGDVEGRELKRAKHVEGEQGRAGSRDPLDCITQRTEPSLEQMPGLTQHHQYHVRFAAIEVESVMEPSQNILQPAPMRPVAHEIVKAVQAEGTEVMDVTASPRKRGGFDPFLLNPMLPSEDVFSPGRLSSGCVTPQPPVPIHDADPSNPFLVGDTQPVTPLPEIQSEAEPMAPTTTPPPPPPPSAPVPDPDSLQPVSLPVMDVDSHHRSRSRSKTPVPPAVNDIEVQEEPNQAPVEAMVVERTPTPPLPDFCVDEGLLMELRHALRVDTSSLTIEQLEQLRATCLGNVWCHRKEWNRDGLVRELLDVVKDFVREVSESWDEDGEED